MEREQHPGYAASDVDLPFWLMAGNALVGILGFQPAGEPSSAILLRIDALQRTGIG
jgi:hypothetical protein